MPTNPIVPISPVLAVSSWFAAFTAGALMLQLAQSHGPGGRAHVVAPVVLVAVALGVGQLTGLRRYAWFVAAVGLPLTGLLLTAPELVIPHRYPGLLPLAGLVPAGLLLAGPLLAVRTPSLAVRLAVGTGLAAAFAVGPLTDGGLSSFVDERMPLGLVWAGAVVLLAAGFALARVTPSELSTGDDRGNGGDVVWSVGLGLLVVGAQYWMYEHGVLRGGDDAPYHSGPHAVPVWQSAFGLATVVTVGLAVLAYRRAGATGARWVVAMAGLALPAVVVFGPLSRQVGTSWWFAASLGLTGLVGVFVGAGLVATLDRPAPWDAIGLLGLIALGLASGLDLYRSPAPGAWLLGVAVTGLVLGSALTRAVRFPAGVGALGVVGVGIAAWVLDLRALAPTADLILPPAAQVAWPALATVALLGLHWYGRPVPDAMGQAGSSDASDGQRIPIKR